MGWIKGNLEEGGEEGSEVGLVGQKSSHGFGNRYCCTGANCGRSSAYGLWGLHKPPFYFLTFGQ